MLHGVHGKLGHLAISLLQPARPGAASYISYTAQHVHLSAPFKFKESIQTLCSLRSVLSQLKTLPCATSTCGGGALPRSGRRDMYHASPLLPPHLSPGPHAFGSRADSLPTTCPGPDAASTPLDSMQLGTDGTLMVLHDAFRCFSGKQASGKRRGALHELEYVFVFVHKQPARLPSWSRAQKRWGQMQDQAAGRRGRPSCNSFRACGTTRACSGMCLARSQAARPPHVCARPTLPIIMCGLSVPCRQSALQLIARYKQQINWEASCAMPGQRRQLAALLNVLALTSLTANLALCHLQGMTPDQFNVFYRFVFHMCREPCRRNIQVCRPRSWPPGGRGAGGGEQASCRPSWVLDG